MTQDLQALFADYWDFVLDETPELAHSVGDERGRARFFRESMDDFDRRSQRRAGFVARLKVVDRDALEEAERNSLELLRRELADADTDHACQAHLRPRLFPFGPETFVSYAISGTSLNTWQDAEDYLQRLRSLPAHFEDCEERLRQGLAEGYRLPQMLLPRVRENVRAQLESPTDQSIWLKPWRASALASQQDHKGLEAGLQDVVDQQVKPALARWHEFLAGDCAASGTCSQVGLSAQPGGEDYYRHLVRHHTTSELSAEDIHQLGLEEVERVVALQAEVATEAGFAGRVQQYRRFLNEDSSQIAPSAAALLTRIQALCKQIDGRIPEFFPHLPRMSYGVEQIPEALAANMPGAYAQPNPPSGKMAGIYWLTTLPERCPAHTQVPLTLHEAWPGHLMHIALLQEMPGVPAFQRYNLAGYMAYAEGWALYCEKLGYDMGLYDTPESRFGQLEMELFRAIRLVIDPGIHLLGWSREQALNFWRRYQSHGDCESEVDRYIGMPGQALAYKMGELEISRLRVLAEQGLGSRFVLRDFHGKLLDCGAVTLPLLRKHVTNWLEAQS